MGIYLPKMEMPKEGFVEILIRDDGTVQQTGQSNRIGGTDYYTPYVGEMPVMYEAVSVPPHGRLVDADAILGKINAIISAHPDEADLYEQDAVIVRDWLRSEPTIIEEEGE